MAFVVNDRVQETTSTIGTGSITLAGASTGYESFSSAIGVGNDTYYAISGDSNEWEVGIGSLTNTTTLTRTTVISSSNSDSLVDFSAGVKNVFCTLPASKATLVNTSNNVIIGNLNTSTALTTKGTSNLRLSTNEGTNSGSIAIANGVNGNISITPNGTGRVVLDGLNYPIADGTNGQFLQTNGTGTLSFATAGAPTINTFDSSSGGTITYVNSQASVQNTAQTTIAVSVPSGISNGNLLIMHTMSATLGNTWTTPTGWTSGATGNNGRGVFWRIASSEPASYTVTQSGSATADAFILAYANAIFDNAVLANIAAASPSTPGTIIVAQPNSTIIYIASQTAASSTYTTPTGYTARVSDSDATGPSGAAFDIFGILAGAYTGPSTTPSTGTCRAYTIALSPIGTTWTKPTTANWVQINLWGGGGGGGRSSDTGGAAGGGGGGAYFSVVLPFSYFTSTVTYVVGTGGSAGGTGGVGGASSVVINNYNNTDLKKVINAYGGGGAGSQTATQGGGGGGGGFYDPGQTSPSDSSTLGFGAGPGPSEASVFANGVFGGGDGGAGGAPPGGNGEISFYGGGGGAGGNIGAVGCNGGNSFYGGAGGGGNASSGTTGGTGGTSIFGGNGANAGNNGASAGTATAPGGGGGGARTPGNASAGAAGRVQFIYW
jgi:hypothetical protein